MSFRNFRCFTQWVCWGLFVCWMFLLCFQSKIVLVYWFVPLVFLYFKHQQTNKPSLCDEFLTFQVVVARLTCFLTEAGCQASSSLPCRPRDPLPLSYVASQPPPTSFHNLPAPLINPSGLGAHSFHFTHFAISTPAHFSSPIRLFFLRNSNTGWLLRDAFFYW